MLPDRPGTCHTTEADFLGLYEMIICGGRDLLSELLSIIPLGIHYVGGANPTIRILHFFQRRVHLHFLVVAFFEAIQDTTCV
jgi:hypothetical protein